MIQILGRSTYGTEGRVSCIGGQGYTTQKTWDQGRTSVHGIASGEPSSWELNLGKVRTRAEQLGVNPCAVLDVSRKSTDEPQSDNAMNRRS